MERAPRAIRLSFMSGGYTKMRRILFIGLAALLAAAAAQPAGASEKAPSRMHFRNLVENFDKLPFRSQVEVVKALREFMSEWESSYSRTYAEQTPEQRERFAAIAQAWFELVSPGAPAWAASEPDW